MSSPGAMRILAAALTAIAVAAGPNRLRADDKRESAGWPSSATRSRRPASSRTWSTRR